MFEGELFQEIADSAPAILWRVDATFEDDWANKGWFDFTGGSLDEQRGFAWVDKVHPDDRDLVVEELGRAFEARRPVTFEFRLRGRSGSYGWIVASGSPVHREGQFAGFIGSCVDISARKEAEVRAQALEEELIRLSRGAIVNSASAGVVEDLGRRLEALALSSTVLEGLLAGREDLPQELLGSAAALREAIDEARGIARSCTNAGAATGCERTRADLGDALLSVEPLLRAQGRAAGIAIEWNLSEGLETEINLVGIQQVLLNLAGNAFEPAAGAPVRRLRIEASAWGALAIVSVADDGPGIPPELRTRMFDASVDATGEGKGTALYLCGSIINAHGGRIWVEAAPDRGAVFKFTLPLAI